MYRCYSCASRIGWFTAASSTVASPIRCDACTVEQHRRLPLWGFLVFAIGFLLTMVFAVVMQDLFASLAPLNLLAFLPLLAAGVGWETFLFRRGEMVATVRRRKFLAQAVMYLLLAAMVALFAFVFFQAQPASAKALSPTASGADYQAVYATCMAERKAELDAASPAGYNVLLFACAEYAADQAKAEMNVLYARIEANLREAGDDHNVARLERTQRAWIVYRDGHCAMQGALIGTPAGYLCHLELDGQRARELREFLQ